MNTSVSQSCEHNISNSRILLNTGNETESRPFCFCLQNTLNLFSSSDENIKFQNCEPVQPGENVETFTRLNLFPGLSVPVEKIEPFLTAMAERFRDSYENGHCDSNSIEEIMLQGINVIRMIRSVASGNELSSPEVIPDMAVSPDSLPAVPDTMAKFISNVFSAFFLGNGKFSGPEAGSFFGIFLKLSRKSYQQTLSSLPLPSIPICKAWKTNSRGALEQGSTGIGEDNKIMTRWIENSIRRKVTYLRHGLLRGHIHLCLSILLANLMASIAAACNDRKKPCVEDKLYGIAIAEGILFENSGFLSYLDNLPLFGVILDNLLSDEKGFSSLAALSRNRNEIRKVAE
ncbi:MAG: hypothetical protein CVV64_04460 [Candidatus Wallbacteria bacterium HGW-Wallbacteria-1]|uniref:Uncharacterized protein n=1 Tax=Candidatus Wallbacteria bacterium HGW-Wallbacteria-1 TaxID=2013854 RepID=A0A2N1PRS4_9BACT|nr:MAG: hypothetical protein CVV64_04460 [Candidatus Wallbacteria bacterium HGW-Wallbacteria-1]